MRRCEDLFVSSTVEACENGTSRLGITKEVATILSSLLFLATRYYTKESNATLLETRHRAKLVTDSRKSYKIPGINLIASIVAFGLASVGPESRQC